MNRTEETGPERYDAVVVGARVAGASTAMLLGGERKVFPKRNTRVILDVLP